MPEGKGDSSGSHAKNQMQKRYTQTGSNEYLTPQEKLVAMLALGQIMDIGLNISGLWKLVSNSVSSGWLAVKSSSTKADETSGNTDLFEYEQSIYAVDAAAAAPDDDADDDDMTRRNIFFKTLRPVDMFIVDNGNMKSKTNGMIPLKPLYDLQKLISIVSKYR